MSLASSIPLPTLVLAAFSALAVAGCGVSVSITGDATTRVETDTVDATGVRDLVVNTTNGAVVVLGDASQQIEIEATIEESDDGAGSFSVDSEDGRLTVSGQCDARAWEVCEVDLEISIPIGLDVFVETDNGSVTVRRIDGAADLNTDNGSIEATALSGDEVRARTDNGRIGLAFDEAPTKVDAETDNGAIVVRVPDAVYAVDATSDNGSIDVEVDTSPDADNTIRARSDNGAVRVEPT